MPILVGVGVVESAAFGLHTSNAATRNTDMREEDSNGGKDDMIENGEKRGS